MATITFNKNGGTGGTDSIDSTSPLTQISVPHKNGYNFIGYVDTTTDIMYYDGGGKLISNYVESLIGSVWYLNSTVDISTAFTYNISFYIVDSSLNDNQTHVYRLICSLENNWLEFDTPATNWYWYRQSASGWSRETARTWYITGGSDVGNTNFISWLNNNATCTRTSIGNLTAQYIPMPVYIDTNFNCISANYGYYGQETIYQSSNDYTTTIGKDNLSLVFDGEYTSSYNPFSYGKNANVDIFVDKDEWSENYCLCIGLIYESGTFVTYGEVSPQIELLDGYGENLNYKIEVPFPSNNNYSHILFSYFLKKSISTKYVRIRISLSIVNNDSRFNATNYSIRPIVYFVPDTRYEMTSLYSVTSRNNMPIGLVDITNNNINVITSSDNEYIYPLKFTQTTHNESNSIDTNFKADRYKVTYTSGNLTTLNDNLTHLQQMLSNEGLENNLYNNSFKLIQNWKLNNNAWYQAQPHLKAGGVWRDVIVPTIKEHINRLVFTNAYVWAQVSQVLTHKQLGGYTYNELYNLDIPYNELNDTYKHYQGYTHDELSNSKHESIGELEE